MALRGIRGATCLLADDADEMRDAVVELLGEMIERNGITTDALVSVLLTSTPDLVSSFPAVGARVFGLASSDISRHPNRH
jgi:chorismate mutase